MLHAPVTPASRAGRICTGAAGNRFAIRIAAVLNDLSPLSTHRAMRSDQVVLRSVQPDQCVDELIMNIVSAQAYCNDRVL